MRMVCALIPPTGGTVRVLGQDVGEHPERVRRVIGYMPQQFSLYTDLTVEQNLHFFADIFQVSREERAKRLRELYRFSRLEPFRRRPAGALSGGMKQKLALSCALIHRPQVLVLDEPTFGVDPLSRQEFWQLLQQIKQEDTGILVSTAYMDEAALCDRVALMHQGRIIAHGAPDNLIRQFPYPLFRLEGTDLRKLLEFFRGIPGVRSTTLFGDALHVSFDEQPEEGRWQQWYRENQGILLHHQPISPTIEDVFLELMKENTDSPPDRAGE
jgi:ABC-2 type transport system ATP-binding protein